MKCKYLKTSSLRAFFLILGVIINPIAAQSNPNEEPNDPLKDISYREIDGYDSKQILKITRERIFPEEDKPTLRHLCLRFGASLTRESLSELLDAYFTEKNPSLKYQIAYLILHIYDPAKLEMIKETFKDPRVKNEEGHEFFFLTLGPILSNGKKEDLAPILQFLSEEKIVDADPYALQNITNIEDAATLNDILDMNSPYLNSPIPFQIALASAMKIESPENTKKIQRILNHVLQNQKSPSSEILAYSLSGAYYDMTQLKKPINIEAYGTLDKIDYKPTDTEWDKKFREKLEIWDEELNKPERIKRITQLNNQQSIDYEIEGAKSRYSINNEDSLSGKAKVQFEDIKLYLSEITGKEYKSIEELEQEAGQKIINLGTYPTEENSFSGDPVKWGDPIIRTKE